MRPLRPKTNRFSHAYTHDLEKAYMRVPCATRAGGAMRVSRRRDRFQK
jgi:hypothetical protein